MRIDKRRIVKKISKLRKKQRDWLMKRLHLLRNPSLFLPHLKTD